MGKGKLAVLGDDGDGTGEQQDEPLTPAEIVSELIYADKTIEQVARMDVYQLLRVYLRPRNKEGDLIRANVPRWLASTVDRNGMRKVSNPVPFSRVFRGLAKERGYSQEELKARAKWIETHPPGIKYNGNQSE